MDDRSDELDEVRRALRGLELEEIEIRVASLVARRHTNGRITVDLGKRRMTGYV